MVNENGTNNRICPRCGASLDDFRRTGLLGCAECYTVFREDILPTVRYTQGKTRHGGRTPEADAGEKYALVLEQELLRGEIERALREERYTQAEEMQKRLKETHRILRGEVT